MKEERKLADLTGKRFGKLIVLYETNPKRSQSGKIRRRWVCLCDCGNKTECNHVSLTKKDRPITSCGCLVPSWKYREKEKDFGIKRRKIRNIWYGMKKRCYNPLNNAYKYYGGRGIIIHTDWHDFESFFNDMYENYKIGLSIERIDVNGNYEKSNCTWIPRGEQWKNRRCMKDRQNK